MQRTRRNIDALVQQVRTRYHRRNLLRGGAINLLALLVCLTTLFFWYPALAERPVTLLLAALAATAGMVWVLAKFLVRPALRTLSDEQIALFIEEHIPDLEDRLNSAVEAAPAGNEPLLDNLLEDAAARTTRIFPGTIVSRLRERFFLYIAGGGVAAFLIFGFANLDRIRLTASEIQRGELAPRPFMTISPGNVDVEKGEAQQVIAAFRKAFNDEVRIAYKQGDQKWTRTTMQPGLDAHSFLWEFFDIQEAIAYYIEADGRRSDVFRISLFEFPAVARIDLAFRFPAYTGLPDRTETDKGNIRGPEGSRVEITVHATGPAEKAAMIFGNSSAVPFERSGADTFTATITLREEDLYSLRLTDADGNTNKFPDQYQIIPVPDAKPRITIRGPGRDTRASAVEEVLIAADAQDDYGIAAFELFYSVNGEPETALDMLASGGGTAASGETLLFLEDFSVEPGDVITYYLQARDAFQEETSDMYFIEIRPFDQSFTQAANPGAGQGAQRQSGLVINQQEIIAATWRLLRSQEDHRDYDASLEALVQAQRNLQKNIAGRIETTALSLELRADKTQRQVVEYLQKAVSEMEVAAADLEEHELRRALTPERRALNNLLRADALHTERQVAQQQRGMGGGMSATEERMSELMDLELDISKNKYEVQQQGSPAEQAQELDAAMQRVKDLARRQQDLAENSNPNQLQGKARKRFVDRLKREQDDLRQQLQEFTESMQQTGSESMQQRLGRAARNMTEAQQALRRNNMTEAMGRQQQALNELRQLQQDMQIASRGSLRERVEALGQDLNALTERENRLAQEIMEAPERDRSAANALEEERAVILEETQELLREARDMERLARGQDQALATALRNLQQQAMRGRLMDHMRASREALQNGWTDTAGRIEGEILKGMERLKRPQEALSQGLPVTEEEELARALNDIQALQSELRRLDAQSQRAGGDDERALETRLQRQLSQARDMVERLHRENAGNEAMQRALTSVQNALVRADHTGVLLDEESAKSFFGDRFYDPLSELEAELWQRLDYLQLARQLYGSRRDEVPAEYRAMVEKYFESLSKHATSR